MRSPRWVRLVRLCLFASGLLADGLLTHSTALAQDMEFSLEETGQPPDMALDDAPPSEALANGLRLYGREQYAEAAVQFSQVVSGETDDSVSNTDKAQFFLAKSLFHLRHYQMSLTIFDEITGRGVSHTHFADALPWLVQLAAQLPEPAGVTELVGRYPASMLTILDRPDTRELYDRLLYMSGRLAYAHGDLEQAILHFDSVHESATVHAEARFFAGVTHVRRRRARPAIEAFRSVIDDADAGRIEDGERMRNLAWLSLARVYYTAANGTDANGEQTVDPALLESAIEAWDNVEPASEYWLDALFEQAWGLFLANEESRSMGNLFTLGSPYFAHAYYPEALILKAVVFFGACQTENAEAMIRQFHERYDSVRDELAQTVVHSQDNEALHELLLGVRSGHSSLPPNSRTVVATALSDRTLLRHLEYVLVLDNETALLERAPEAFRDSQLGNRIRADLAVTHALAVDRTGGQVRVRLTRLVEELDELMNQMDTVEIEIYRVRREGLTQEQRAERERIRAHGGLEVEIDEEHQVWIFDGEYWRDELPYYRQRVSSICTR